MEIQKRQSGSYETPILSFIPYMLHTFKKSVVLIAEFQPFTCFFDPLLQGVNKNIFWVFPHLPVVTLPILVYLNFSLKL